MDTMAKPASEAVATTTVTLTSDGRRLRIPVSVAAGPTRWRVVLPLLQSITNQIVDAAVGEAESAGRRVSCQKGCTACCRHAVPLAHVEADLLRSLIQRMPPARRATVLARFADARRRLANAGMLEPMEHPDRVPPGEWRALGIRYFALGIACPFLEDEACSIYADRPLACREYLVTSPAENCSHPDGQNVDGVRLGMKPSVALLEAARPASDGPTWTPLILASQANDGRPTEPEPRPGPELVKSFFHHLGRRGPATGGR
jgi:Fe-S-cluster containining protein